MMESMEKSCENSREKVKEKVVLVSAGVSKAEYSQFARFLPMTAVGLHYIAAILKQEGYPVEIVNQTNDGLSNDEVKQKINEIRPGHVFFNQFFSTRERIRDIISGISNEPIIAVGGHDPTFHSQRLEKGEMDEQYKGIDYVWQGEAENGLASEMSLMIKQESPAVMRKLNTRIRNLDELPILKHDDYSGDVGFLSTSRGCYQKGCDICTTPSFYPEGWKARSVEHTAKEIENLKKAGKKFVFICDDNFLGFTEEHLKRGSQIIEKCKEAGLKVMIMTTKEQILKASEKQYLSDWTGTVYRCFLGIESGGEYIKDKIGKITDSSQHAKNSREAIKTLYNNGIGLFAGWINFKPDSTFDELEQDAKFLLENGAECANFTNLCQSLRLYEGTKIYEKHKHRNVKVQKGEFDYDFDIPEIGEFYRFLMFKVRNEITDQLDNLIYETTDLIYINQLQNNELGIKYWKLRNDVNRHNYDFFINCLNAYKAGKGNESIDANEFIEISKSYVSQFETLKKEIANTAEYK